MFIQKKLIKTLFSCLFSCILFTLISACDGEDRTAATTATAPAADTTTASDDKEDLGEVLLTEENVEEVLTAYGKENPETQVIISTNMGDIKIRLYEDTPFHRANFIRLAKMKFYDNSVFHRVIQDFMIQGGGSDTRKIKIGNYQVPMESNPKYFHKRGALAMAKRDEDKGSSAYNFFIIQGTKLSPAQVEATAKEYNLKLTPEQMKTYSTIGGVPALDGNYTVFGEVTEGLDVVDKIAAVETDKNGWPINDVVIQMKILK